MRKKENIMRPIMLIAALAFASCASQPGPVNELEVVRTRASFDFNCSEDKISVQSNAKELYMAQGCGKKSSYKIQCSLGPCQALSSN